MTQQRLDSLDLRELLLLRLAFDDPDDIVDIEQDIDDLMRFPERLNCSYPDEWRSYLKRQFRIRQLDESDVLAVLRETDKGCVNDGKIRAALQTGLARYKPKKALVDKVSVMLADEHIVPLKTPLHRWLEWAVS